MLTKEIVEERWALPSENIQAGKCPTVEGSMGPPPVSKFLALEHLTASTPEATTYA